MYVVKVAKSAYRISITNGRRGKNTEISSAWLDNQYGQVQPLLAVLLHHVSGNLLMESVTNGRTSQLSSYRADYRTVSSELRRD